MNDATPTVEKIDHLRMLVEKAKVAMLTTVDSQGQLRSRPLHTLEVDGDGGLWFVMRRQTPKLEEIETHEGQVGLSYANPSDQEYVSISGQAQLSHDPKRKAELWNPMVEVFFPKGVDDPAIVLLRVEPEKGEYWDGAGNVVTQLYAFAKAKLTGNFDALGEHQKLQF